MSNHLARRVAPGSRVVGVRELKTHAARILRDVRDQHASYTVTHRGRAAGVILPVDAAHKDSPVPEDTDAAAAWEAFMRAGRRIQGRFRRGASGVDLLSRMRR